ncbi:MAG: glycosyltransferase [Planctomycetota bacterium]
MPNAPLILHARVVGNQGGGPDKTVFNSARYAAPRYRMAAAYIHPATDAGETDLAPLRRLAAANGCPLHAIPERGPLSLTTYHEALRLCRELGVAVWHAHDYKTDLLGLALRRQHPMKLVTTVHGWMPVTHKLAFYEAIDRRLLRFYDHVFAVSPPLLDAARQFGVSEHRLTYLPNGIETQGRPSLPTRDDARASLGLSDRDDDVRHVACIGRLSNEKRLDRAIRVIARLREAGHAVHLHLIGEGPQRPVLEDAVRRLKLADRVTFHGWQTDTAPHLAAADAVLLTSETEGLPNALLEAMHAGVPVAATPVGGVPDLLAHGRCGVLLDPADEDAWPEHLAALLHNTAEREHFIATAKQQITNRFTFATRMDRVLGTYDALLAASHSACIAA